jgi:DNA polymerase-3 subunit epsilon
MYKWQLERPLAVLDIEATGINPRTDRIIELSIIKIPPKGERRILTYKVNPGMPIPPEATAIHGIKDSDVADAPLFPAIAPAVYKELDGCDLGGYNLIRFDIPMLIEEFLRASITFSMNNRFVVDAQRIFHKKEPRDLKAALAFYCNEIYLEGHHAEADALATVRVLEGQLSRYSDLPRSIAELDKYCDLRDPSWADRDGKLRWLNGEVTINFGKKKGEKLTDLAAADPGFLKWILRGDFASDTKAIVTKVLQGKRPDPIGTGLGDQLTTLRESGEESP